MPLRQALLALAGRSSAPRCKVTALSGPSTLVLWHVWLLSLGIANIDSAGFEILEDDDCYTLLSSVTLGRVGVTIAALPAIFPVNFALIQRQIVFSTGTGTKLTAALSATVVAFEADWVDEANRAAWSVQAVGRSMIVEAASDMEAAAKVAVRALAPVARPYLVKIMPARISGRRLPKR